MPQDNDFINNIFPQVEEVLSKDSAQVLEDGENPGPLEEIKFWESKKVNLESLFEQMKAPTTRNMASILNVTDSAYYPCFKYEKTGIDKNYVKQYIF